MFEGAFYQYLWRLFTEGQVPVEVSTPLGQMLAVVAGYAVILWLGRYALGNKKSWLTKFRDGI